MQYVINYSCRDRSYSEQFRNCQVHHFVTAFCKSYVSLRGYYQFHIYTLALSQSHCTL
jgi:hypothetical protein